MDNVLAKVGGGGKIVTSWELVAVARAKGEPMFVDVRVQVSVRCAKRPVGGRIVAEPARCRIKAKRADPIERRRFVAVENGTFKLPLALIDKPERSNS